MFSCHDGGRNRFEAFFPLVPMQRSCLGYSNNNTSHTVPLSAERAHVTLSPLLMRHPGPQSSTALCLCTRPDSAILPSCIPFANLASRVCPSIPTDFHRLQPLPLSSSIAVPGCRSETEANDPDPSPWGIRSNKLHVGCVRRQRPNASLFTLVRGIRWPRSVQILGKFTYS